MSPLYWFILAYLVVGVIVAFWLLQMDNKEQRVDPKGKLHDIERELDGSSATSSADAIGTVLGYLVGTLLWPVSLVNIYKAKQQRQVVQKPHIEVERILRKPDPDDD